MWTKLKIAFHKLGSPPIFYRVAQALIPWLWALTGVGLAVGLYQALYVVPPDYQQGDSYRILYVHVPAAWQAMASYLVMAILAVIALVWRIRTAEIMAMACAPIGAGFTLICLVTGAIWGEPMWGTWWAWDARLTSMLILLFVYLGIMGLYAAFDDRRQGAKMASILVLAGVVNIPIIHFSVEWWTTLHQGSTINLFGPSTMDPAMLPPLIWMTIAVKLMFGALLLQRARNELLFQDQRKQWVLRFVQGRRDDS
ncbi:MAG: heme ABC transporter permease [Wenzhouxiangella sp.]|jgi:heme exporter protein C|nr:heme ABC transporter permease [Wenzhouxiangella sp.]MDR9453682.1 heme ABC transporter permease [Wenzhouxiangella sp.]